MNDIQRILQDMMTPTRAAEIVGVDRATVYRWIQAGHLPTYQDNAGRTVVLRSDLETAVNRAAASKAAQFERALDKLPDALNRIASHEGPHGRQRISKE